MGPELLERIDVFLNGVITMGHATAGLFFLRFWTKTHDRLFIMFALAFLLLGVIRVSITFFPAGEDEHYYYWFRLVAFLAILAAIVDKNWKR
jgi:uncharacterized membrane protein HdeD (DUF308 family)